MRRAFTLIEILIALMLIGVGMTAILGVILRASRDAQEASLWAMSTVNAEAAVDMCLGRGLITTTVSGPVDLPEAEPSFQSPFPLRIDVVSIGGSASAPLSASSNPAVQSSGSFTAAAATGTVVWVRARVYDQPGDRAAGIRPRATYHVRRLLRPLP